MICLIVDRTQGEEGRGAELVCGEGRVAMRYLDKS